MANDLNQCTFIGRLGADPETRYMPSGGAVCNFRIAVGWKGKDKEGTEWVPIVVFGKLAEICGEYLSKGSRVCIVGKFRTRKWQDQQGQDRYTTEVVVDVGGTMQMLDSRGPEGAPASREASEQQRSAPPVDNGFEDEIPF